MRYQIRHAIVKYAADTILEDVNFEIKNSNHRKKWLWKNNAFKADLR